MQFGVWSNGQRQAPLSAAATYDEDLWELVVADELGYDEGWVSEHFGSALGNALPDADLLICKAAALTSQIRMGPAVRILPVSHPVAVARQAATCDQLLGGRYLMGFGAGGPPTPYAAYGVDRADRHTMMREAIDLVVRAWTAPEPFDHVGQHWQCHDVNVQPKPVQQPHPPIGVATDSPDFIELCAQRGYRLLVGHYDDAALVRKKGELYVAAAPGSGASTEALTVARQVYVSTSTSDAMREIREDMERHIEYFKRLKFPVMLHLPPGGSVEDVNFDQLCEAGFFIVGDPDSVASRLTEFYEEVGGFGRLLLVLGKDWGTRDQREQSLRLFRDEVVPKLAHLHPPTL